MFYLSLKSFLKLNFWKTFKTFYLSIIIIFSNFVNQKNRNIIVNQNLIFYNNDTDSREARRTRSGI